MTALKAQELIQGPRGQSRQDRCGKMDVPQPKGILAYEYVWFEEKDRGLLMIWDENWRGD